MESARVTLLLRPFLGEGELGPAQIAALQAYLSLLMRWNARTNLTAVRDEESIVVRHIGESLFAARHLLPDPTTVLTVIDLGSGAGFPGLPLKVYAPAVDLTFIESQNKKATFLKEAIRTMRLDAAKVFAGRAEAFGGQADLVTMRAVEHFEDVVQVAASLVRNNVGHEGRLALLIGEGQINEAEALLPDFSWVSPVRVPLSSARVVLAGSRSAQ